jgi:regulator of sigma E protease
MLTIILVILGISFLILIHEAGHFFVAKKFNMKVEEFGFGIPPRIYGKKIGETIYSINLFPFGGFVKIAGENDLLDDTSKNELKKEVPKERLFRYQAPYKKALVTVAGVLMNFLIGWILISTIFTIGRPFSILVAEVMPNSVAYKSGIRANDIVLGFNNEIDLKKFIAQNPEKEISLKIQRGKDIIDINLIPQKNEKGEGFIGVYFVGGGIPKEKNILKAFYNGFILSLNVLKMNFFGLYELFYKLFTTGKIIEGVTGPIGIFYFSKQIGDYSLIYFLNLLGIISISLAFVNMLPFPALDGGRLLFILIEKIKGKPLSYKIETILNSIGFLLLIFLLIMITIKDVKFIFRF